MTYELSWISGSPNAWRVMLAMEIKGLTYVSHRLDPSKGDHKSPEHLALNPWGKVPVLKDGEFVIYESIAILAYLEQKHPHPPLFGSTPQETGHIWQRIFEVMNYGRDAINNGVVRPLIRGQASSTGDAIQSAAKDVHVTLAWGERILADTPYLAGNDVSGADVTYLPIFLGLERAGHRQEAVSLSLNLDRLGILYPNIASWRGRMEKLPGYDRAYPPHWR